MFVDLNQKLVTFFIDQFAKRTKGSRTTPVFDYPAFLTDVGESPYVCVYPESSTSEPFEFGTRNRTWTFTVMCVCSFDQKAADVQPRAQDAMQVLRTTTDFLISNVETKAFNEAIGNNIPIANTPSVTFALNQSEGLFLSSFIVPILQRTVL